MGDPLLINFGCLEKFLLSQAKNAFQSKFGASVIDRSGKTTKSLLRLLKYFDL